MVRPCPARLEPVAATHASAIDSAHVPKRRLEFQSVSRPHHALPPAPMWSWIQSIHCIHICVWDSCVSVDQAISSVARTLFQAQCSDHCLLIPYVLHRALGLAHPAVPRLGSASSPCCPPSRRRLPARFASMHRTFSRYLHRLAIHLWSVPLAVMHGLLLLLQADAAQGADSVSSVCRRSRPSPSVFSVFHRRARLSPSPVLPVQPF